MLGKVFSYLSFNTLGPSSWQKKKKKRKRKRNKQTKNGKLGGLTHTCKPTYLRFEDHEFKANIASRARPCEYKTTMTKTKHYKCTEMTQKSWDNSVSICTFVVEGKKLALHFLR
jgi:hypothetical protein